MKWGSTCYCYGNDCNQSEWEKLGKPGKRQYVVVSDIALRGEKVPRCPYCKNRMTVTATIGVDGDFE